MTCQTCKRMRERMTSLILRRQQYREKRKQQAARASAEHQQQGMEAAEAAGTGERSVPMPSVQEDSDRA